MTSLRLLFAPLLAVSAALGLLLSGALADEPQLEEAEVVVYGGTPAGIAAALAAGKAGNATLLVEPYSWVGGLTTNGLSHPDFRTFEGLTGTYLEFTRRVRRHYLLTNGDDSPQVRDCLHGTHGGPHVNRQVFESMLAEVANVRVSLRTALTSVEVRAAPLGKRIVSARFVSGDGQAVLVRAPLWIDATYEGDLMAAAGVEFRVGREGREEYGESLAPDSADSQVQGYNFRLVMTRDPAQRVAPQAPPGYRREDFLPLAPLLEAGKFKSVFCYPSGGIYKAQIPSLPNGKHDINDVSRGLVRLSLPGMNRAWPTGDAATRKRVFDEHVRHNLGMIYFLQNDPAVPARFREEAREWGWSRDEFVESNHLPEQLYVREARRMKGLRVFTERDTDHAPGDARAVLHRDSIAIGDYGHNCHGTHHEGERFGGRHTGEFYKATPPYQIPYGTIVPRDCENLLVPVACSASHVGFCALRLEPIWTSLGQAAGYAAHTALGQKKPVQQVNLSYVQQRLHFDGAATIYLSDVPPDAPGFLAAQWWGNQGGWHGLAPRLAEGQVRGENIVGQYYKTFPGHAMELDKPLDDELRARWLKLAGTLGIQEADLRDARTRADFIRLAFANYQEL